MRTPSPNRGFDLKNAASPETNGNGSHLLKSAKLNHISKQLDVPSNTETKPSAANPEDERKSSVPKSSIKENAAINSSDQAAAPPSSQQNQWQQATSRKGHKKSKSNSGANAINGTGGQPLPANEAERKGG
jgi:hypothetical protein